MERLLEALIGKDASEATRESFRQRFRERRMNDIEIEIEVEQTPADAVRDSRAAAMSA